VQPGLIRSTAIIALFCFSTLSLMGCGGDDGTYQGPTGTVSGVVKLGGKPLAESATVTFLSKEGYAATGQTDSSGKFTLSYQQGAAIPVGTYSVSVMPAVAAASEGKAEEFFEESGESKESPTKSTIPEKVRSPGGSGISKEVKEGANTLDIEI